MSTSHDALTPTSTHWGNYRIEVDNGRIKAVHPYSSDQNPTPIGQSLLDALDERVRIAQPMIRAGYLERGADSDRSGRGAEPFVAVSWEQALELVANELARVKQNYGNEAIFAGSYGWASAGRFHHAQSQLRRFLNMWGGFTYSVNSYSLGAGYVILPHIMGSLGGLLDEIPPWSEVAEHTQLVVLFGGAGLKNTQISAGGLGPHTAQDDMLAAKQAGVQFVNVSPIRDDLAHFLAAEWISLRPNSDTALMLALAHTLVIEDLHDQAFLRNYCVGFDRFLAYLLGDSDGQPKDALWAEPISNVPAGVIRDLARRMARQRTIISVSWSLQRAEYGEQPFWMATVLAAMLGEIGLPGRGIAFGYGAMHSMGSGSRLPFQWPSVAQGKNKVRAFIPVARIADMLLQPGQPFNYNGQTLLYPDIKLVYWAGGNPFHHHQDLNRLLEAWRKPETIIIHEPWWNANARHADIVLPATTALERNDIGLARDSSYLSPMRQAVQPFKMAKNDHDIFVGLADRLGFKDAFTENKDEMAWVRSLYEEAAERAEQHGIKLPDFEAFWLGEQISIQDQVTAAPSFLARFRQDPTGSPLTTPSGKIEIFSETIAAFDYHDCPGHPVWMAPDEWLGAAKAKTYPLHLISNQPKTRLHSQFDHGVASRRNKLKGREPARMNPKDAQARGMEDGQLIRIFNDRGACLARLVVSDDIRPGIVQLPTGAWYNPLEPGQIGSLERHGNPNVLTRDKGTSQLAQGATAHSTLVEVERYQGPDFEVTAFQPPQIVTEGT
ncbi:MAG: molybdopterin-dependent oxidoreductase [Anaerolineae bacterium]|nr:molybdopterin-dependent oxidoreductase [Anaerolineae bacterium]